MNILKTVSALAVLTFVAIGMASTGTGQTQAPAPGQAPGRGQAAAEAPPPPPAPPGHPSGELVRWGEVVTFDPPGTPNQCVATTRFKRNQRVGFRMTAIDGGSGEVENTAVLVAHVTYGGRTVDVPMRWRGNTSFPKDQYLRAPTEMWTGAWTVPADASIGVISYTVTATDRFKRTATFTPFPAKPSQLTIVE